MPKVKWDKEEEVLPTISAKARSSRKNMAKARAVREENARKRKLMALDLQQSQLQKAIEARQKDLAALPEKIAADMKKVVHDEALQILRGKRSLKELAKNAAWKVYVDAGGIKRHEEIVKADDAAFLRHFRDIIVPLSKGDNNEDRNRTIVRVNILGAPGGDVNVAMQIPGSGGTFGEEPEEPAALDYEADPQEEG